MCPPKASGPRDRHRVRGDDVDDDDDDVDPAVRLTLDRAIARASDLSSLIRRTASLRLALRASINIADDVSRRHAELLLHSGELSAAAERLQHEEGLLSRRAEEIGMPLRHYDAVDRMGALVGVAFREGGRVVVRGTAKLHVDDAEEYARVLETIDDAVEFFGGGGAAIAAGGGGRRPGGGDGGEGGRGRPAGAGAGAAERALESAAASSSGSAEYYRRACALQDAALELLRVGVADRITQTSAQIQDALHLPRVPMASDKLEASLVYTRFHGISRRSNSLISIARRRLDALGSGSHASASYEDLLALCRNAYCGARETLLTSTVRHHMDTLRERHGLVGMTRLASVFLIRLCTVETALYLDFFGDPEKRRHPRRRAKGALGSSDADREEEGKDSGCGGGGDEKEQDGGVGGDDAERGPNSQQFRRLASSSSHPAAAALASQILSEDSTYRDAEFQAMLGSLCSALHRTIRRGLVSVLDLDVLCQVVSVLREERSAANSSPTTLAAARAVSGVIQDAQERLIFCANDALHKEVSRFKPSASDLNYPGKLLGEKPKVAIVIDDDATTRAAPDAEKDEERKPDEAETGPPPADDAVAAQLRTYEAWFPPMRSVLRILSKIFRVVEPRVFEDIALQSVQSCTKSLKDGSVHILRKSGQIHADLFLVKHLLVRLTYVSFHPFFLCKATLTSCHLHMKDSARAALPIRHTAAIRGKAARFQRRRQGRNPLPRQSQPAAVLHEHRKRPYHAPTGGRVGTGIVRGFEARFGGLSQVGLQRFHRAHLVFAPWPHRLVRRSVQEYHRIHRGIYGRLGEGAVHGRQPRAGRVLEVAAKPRRGTRQCVQADDFIPGEHGDAGYSSEAGRPQNNQIFGGGETVYRGSSR